MALSLSAGRFAGGLANGLRGVKTGWRHRVLWLSSRDASETLLTGFAIAVMAISTVATASRSGFICLALVIAMLGWWMIRRQPSGSRKMFGFAHLLVVLFAAVSLGGIEILAGRLYNTSWSNLDGRLDLWQDTIRVVRDFPLTGTGLNSYGIAMLHYQTLQDGSQYIEAHNDYLQILAEGGLLLGLPILLTLLLFIREVWRRFREGVDDTRAYWLRAGAVTGLCAIAIQESSDFTLQMPGAAVLFVVLAAIAIHRPVVRGRSLEVGFIPPAARTTAVVVALLAVFGSPAEARRDPWIQVHSPRFVVTSNASEEQARRVARDFERARTMLERTLANVRFDSGQPIVILAVDGQDSLRELMPQFWEQKGERPAGAYWGGPYRHCIAMRVDVPAREQFRLALHEYLHLLTHTNVPDLPPWLDEGLSEFWGMADVRDNAVEIGRAEPNHVKLLTGQRPWIPLEELLGLEKVPEARDKHRLSLFYAESWALVEYLMMRPNGDLTLRPAVDFANLLQLAPVLSDYVRRERFGARLLAIPRWPESADGRRDDALTARVLPPARSLALRAGCLADGLRPAAARPLLAAALRADSGEPSVLETLGYLDFEQNQAAEAAGWFDRAIASGSASHLAYFYRAVLAGSVPDLTGSAEPVLEDDYLKRAIELAPGFTPAYVRLADLYERRGDRQEALRLMKRATELEPENAAYWADLGNLLIRSSRSTEAREAGERGLEKAGSARSRELLQAFLRSLARDHRGQ
jgi:tetratricopeptide (TPR) repeat protein